MFAKAAEVAIQLLDPLLVSLDTFSLESFLELEIGVLDQHIIIQPREEREET